MEIKFPPGVDRDIIIVNSDVGSIEGNEFIEKLDNKKISGGEVLTFTRNNIGLSYGAYSDAFLKFRSCDWRPAPLQSKHLANYK